MVIEIAVVIELVRLGFQLLLKFLEFLCTTQGQAWMEQCLKDQSAARAALRTGLQRIDAGFKTLAAAVKVQQKSQGGS